MKTAFACWDNRIAPVFDTARHIHLVETEAGVIVRQREVALAAPDLPRRVAHLAELGVQTLVCGAISRECRQLVIAKEIRLLSFLAGDLPQIIDAWLVDGLSDERFAMPGCHARQAGCTGARPQHACEAGKGQDEAGGRCGPAVARCAHHHTNCSKQ